MKQCRSRIAPLFQKQRETFLMEQFRGSIDKNISDHATGSTKFKMDFKINIDLSESYHVCRKVFAYCWGISEYEIKQISRALKVADGGYCESYTTRILNDSSNLGTKSNKYIYSNLRRMFLLSVPSCRIFLK